MSRLFGGGDGPTLLPALASAWCLEYPEPADLLDSPPLPADDGAPPPGYSPYSALLRNHSMTSLSRAHLSAGPASPPLSPPTSGVGSSISPSTLQTALNELFVIASFGSHQVRAIGSGLYDVVTTGSARPAWNYQMHLCLHMVRQNVAFQGLSIPRLRFWSNAAGASSLPEGVHLKQIRFTVDRDVLLGFENAGATYRKDTKAGQYPTVPKETEKEWKSAKKRYDLDGEWLTYESTAPPTPTANQPASSSSSWLGSATSWLGSWYGSSSAQKALPPPPLSTSASTESLSSQVIYYLHGGAYIAGSPEIYRTLTGRIAKDTKTRVFALKYRLAPETPFPGGLHDAFAGYLYLINPQHPAFRHLDPTHAPVDPRHIIFMGDSAGAGLCLALLNYLNLYLRSPTGEYLVPLPAACAALSPWCDLTFTSHSWRTNDKFDWLPAIARDIHSPVAKNVPHPVYMYLYGEHCTETKVELAARTINATEGYFDGYDQNKPPSSPTSPTSPSSPIAASIAASIVHDRVEQFVRHPLVSPIFADTFEGLPPLLIQAGDAEVLRDDSLALAYKFDADNVGHNGSTSWVRHELYPDMVHVWIAMAWLKESTVATGRIVRFLEEVRAGEPMEPEEADDGVLIDSHTGI
ncbi:hypothetical protein HDU89_006533 [Geranomyces variabilis]|nr:hypothetical protein HDU89_006533 [Geranomyces variabilis]